MRRRLLLGLLVLFAVTALWQAVTWPQVAKLASEDPDSTAFIERYRRSSDAEDRPLAWRPVPYGAISPHLKRAVLVAEDIEFFSHNGFATGEIRAALGQAWREKRPPRGASTLSQQLVKNLWLSPSRNPLRKLKEAALTVQLERHLGKRRILELYLNVAEMGPGLYGAEAASRHYFGTSASALSEHQAAQLAATLSRPSSWNPSRNSSGYTRRVALISRRMAKAKFLWRQI
ncbi:MAG: monofunctional biosynthetic peptidoglycan transglycosylase [Acidobacteriota bacterium]